jgi:CDP-glucose 4,6-dehydratase
VVDLASIYRGKTVLVTGDTGFKGSWLAIWLVELGAKVIGYALPPTSPRDNFVACGLAQAIEHVDGDVRNYDQLAAVITKHQPEIVFHLAAQAIVLESYKDPRATFDTNVMGVVNVLEAVRHTPSVRAVVVVTSDKCYENHDLDRGFLETDPLGGHDPYSGSKGAAEIAAASMRRSFFDAEGTAAIATARAGNVIGGGDWAPHRIIPDCIRALLAGEPVVIRNPAAVRPWQHVLDALHGYLVLGARLITDGKRYAGGWNFGPLARSTVPVRELVDALIVAWGEGTAKLDASAAAKPAEARFLHLDSAKAVSELVWSPRLALPQALSMTVEGYRAERDTASVYVHRVGQIRTFHGLS